MKSFRIVTISFVLAAFLAPQLAQSGPGEPISLSIPGVRVSGTTATVPVTNATLQAIDVEVVGHYHDGTQVHTSSTTVTVPAKGTALASIGWTITDDIDPDVEAVEDPDPMFGGIAFTALWDD